MNIVCSQCNKDDAIQKVSAVVAGGQASGSFSGYSGGAVNIDGKWGSTSSYTTLGGTSASDLARTLAPPPEPRKQSPGISAAGCIGALLAFPIAGSCFILMYGIPMAILALVNFASSPSSSDSINFISGVGSVFIFLCFCLVLFWILLREANKEKDKRVKEIDIKFAVEKSSWEKAMVRWNRLYYCHRDGIVFDTENGETCQPTQMKEFVYK